MASFRIEPVNFSASEALHYNFVDDLKVAIHKVETLNLEAGQVAFVSHTRTTKRRPTRPTRFRATGHTHFVITPCKYMCIAIYLSEPSTILFSLYGKTETFTSAFRDVIGKFGFLPFAEYPDLTCKCVKMIEITIVTGNVVLGLKTRVKNIVSDKLTYEDGTLASLKEFQESNLADHPMLAKLLGNPDAVLRPKPLKATLIDEKELVFRPSLAEEENPRRRGAMSAIINRIMKYKSTEIGLLALSGPARTFVLGAKEKAAIFESPDGYGFYPRRDLGLSLHLPSDAMVLFSIENTDGSLLIHREFTVTSRRFCFFPLISFERVPYDLRLKIVIVTDCQTHTFSACSLVNHLTNGMEGIEFVGLAKFALGCLPDNTLVSEYFESLKPLGVSKTSKKDRHTKLQDETVHVSLPPISSLVSYHPIAPRTHTPLLSIASLISSVPFGLPPPQNPIQ
jgi:hypothetical protein